MTQDKSNGDQGRRAATSRRSHPRNERLLRSQEAVDGLIASAEELNLMGRRRVPEDWAPRLDAAARMLSPEVPPELCSELRPRIGVSRLMDALFGVSEQLQLQRLGIRAAAHAAEHQGHEENANTLP